VRIAIIPARKGSKRLVNKNIKVLQNKPLIAWTIEAALESECFDRVFVTTDCEKIASISKKCGAEVPFLRSDYLATDTSTSVDVISNFITQLFERNIVNQLDIVGLLQPTSPLRNGKHISNAFSMMESRKADAVVSVCEVDHPPELSNFLDDSLSMNGFIKKGNIKRTQDYKTSYRLNGAIYLFNQKYFKSLDFYQENTFAYIMDRGVSVDIDTLEDFMLAEVLLNSKG